MNLYNDNDQTCFSWLRRLVAAGHLPEGEVTGCGVQWLTPDEIRGYTSAHFFAGVGGWPLALRMAGWPDDKPVWTASLPCQPFSNAGKRKGVHDDRHLWPVFRNLVEECRPPTIFGEQVASKDGREWLAGVRTDLEALGYAVGAADLCAAGVGSPHIRQRLFWVADADQGERRRVADGEGRQLDGSPTGWQQGYGLPQSSGNGGGLADAIDDGRREERADAGGVYQGDSEEERAARHSSSRADGGLADADKSRRGARRAPPETPRHRGSVRPTGWAGARWHLCLDGKHRRIPVEPELFPLAHGLPGSVGQLRAYGNAIVPQVAATFVRAFMDCAHD